MNEQPRYCPEETTVRRPDIFGQVHDTHQTEAELNGWRASQGALFPLPQTPPRRDQRQKELPL